jgi:hypothetical protein
VVTEPLRPTRGGFLRPFGCGWFIREFLLGKGPYGSLRIEPEVGAPQADIFHYYKQALFHAYAEDRVALEEEERIGKSLPPLSVEEAEERTKYYLERMPQKLSSMRYASFTRYFSHLKRLGYVEKQVKKRRHLYRRVTRRLRRGATTGSPRQEGKQL